MNITTNLEITLNSKNHFVINFGENKGIIDVNYDEGLYNELKQLLKSLEDIESHERGKRFSEAVGRGECEKILDVLDKIRNGELIEPENACVGEERILRGLDNLINFFSEFEFEPNFRFVNSIAHKPTIGEKKEYIVNYFRLLDNAYSNDVEHKMRSKEFDKIMEDLSEATPKERINNRLKIYYGSAGTGKTTKAQKESDGRCIVCNNSMFPSDIMEDFVFVEGNPSFNPSIFWECMEQGKPIVLDEINLLPFDTLRFLQGLLDGKKTFNYKGKTVTIKDGFEVIGTMNLNIGGTTFGLPEPLVDRSYDFKEFRLSAEQLLGALV